VYVYVYVYVSMCVCVCEYVCVLRSVRPEAKGGKDWLLRGSTIYAAIACW